jgi:diamine N-acetyltransferase
MPEITVRRATPEDANLLTSLATVSFYEAYFEQDDSHDLADYLVENFSTSVISTDLSVAKSIYLIAFRGGKAVGYAKLRDGEVHESVTNRNAIELQRCYLIERVWGTGIGDVLLDRCFSEARTMGKEVLWLGVWEENERGLSFYRKHGFERVGTLTFPYGDSVGINAVMEIRL